MENKQIPIKKEPTNDRPAHSLFDLDERPRTREEEFDTVDEDHEISFDLPRD